MNDAVHIGIRGASMTSLLEQVPAPLSESTPSSSISPLDLAYFAGIVDGEGTITISRLNPKSRRARNGKVYVSSAEHLMSLSVSMSEMALVHLFYETFGGYFHPMKGTNKPMYRWQVTAAKAVDPLRALLPYLRVKVNQARIAIMFQTQRTNQSGTIAHGSKGRIVSKRISDPEMLFRDDMCTRIQALNQGVTQ